MKNLLIFAICVLLSACGGGGGGGSNIPVNNTYIGPVTTNLMPGMAVGDFVGDGGKYVVLSGWLFSNSAFTDPPVKIYKLNSNGGGTDVTTQVIGPNISASTHIPLVADFNSDGIDDIFLPGFYDTPVGSGPSYVFISRRGTTHQKTILTNPTWSHDATTVDIDSDGDVDVINNNGEMWLNDGAGHFTFKPHSWQTSNFWMHGNGVCAGDFNNSGTKQLVITDLSLNGMREPIADTVIFELSRSLSPVASHTLPLPILDRNTSVETSHDYTCRVADVNNDGMMDIVVFSRPLDTARNNVWTEERFVQVLINRGNFVFEDSAQLGYYQTVESDYMPDLSDFNRDGKIDLWLAPTLFINKGAGNLEILSYNFGANVVSSKMINFNRGYGLFYIKDSGIYFTKTDYTF